MLDSKKKLRHNLYLNCGILPKWHDKTFKEFTNDKVALRTVKKYISRLPAPIHEGVGLFLYGANGVGKTHLMMTAFKALIDSGYSCKVISFSTLITKFTAEWYNTEEGADFRRALREAKVFGIEDLGKEFRSANSENLGIAALSYVLKFRIQMGKPVWMTSDFEPAVISERYGEDIASMLLEACLPVKVAGSDYRNKIADKIYDNYNG